MAAHLSQSKMLRPLKELTDPMSVGAWVNPDGITGWQNIVEMDGGAGWKFGFHGSKEASLDNISCERLYADLDTVIAEERMEHMSQPTWNGKEAIIYVNGEEDDRLVRLQAAVLFDGVRRTQS